MHYPLISNNFLEGYSELLAEGGIDANALFHKAQFDSHLLRWPDTLVPFDQHNHLLMLAAERLKCPHFGLALAARQGLSIFGPLAVMVSSCTTVGQALNIFSNHISLMVQTVELKLEQQGPLAQLTIVGHFDRVASTTTFQDHALALAYELVRIFCGSQWLPRAVYFQHQAPVDVKPYAHFFHSPIGFNHTHLALVFDAAILETSIDSDARLLPQKLRRYLEQRHQDDLLKQVRHVIALTLPCDECQIESVAHTIGYSKRTLQRRLSALDTSFQQLVEAVRRTQATHYIEHPYYRLTDISVLLGYSELSAFTRSFKRWFGVSPQRWKMTKRQTNKAPAS
ncbi:AraC family transcriptional regulator [Simiduia curdlanivorans]|uniref:AraC family transcriptional regulator n=1 Tax=Simiduia curdlanivorans TaxID=1492769 RepID=A0ABV8V5J2_9GAMM|nr:AraC family transcriptional regulator [Simiduia curdlanivorans]MDN3638152.1 AraC family transcriptional regulator [Simiduia curdlanivorans]